MMESVKKKMSMSILSRWILAERGRPLTELSCWKSRQRLGNADGAGRGGAWSGAVFAGRPRRSWSWRSSGHEVGARRRGVR